MSILRAKIKTGGGVIRFRCLMAARRGPARGLTCALSPFGSAGRSLTISMVD